jgi:hypothetical protein
MKTMSGRFCGEKAGASIHSRRRFICCAALLCWALSLVNSQASLLLSEDFNYATGSLNGRNGGTGFSEPWTATTAGVEIRSGGLTYTRADGYTYDGGSGRLQLTGNSDDCAHRAFSAYSGSDLYISMLMKVSGTLQDNDFGAAWFNNTGGPGFGLKANQGGGGSGTSGTYDLFARAVHNGDGPGSATFYQNLTIDQTYLLVVRYSKSAGAEYKTADLWVNPTYASSRFPNASLEQSGLPDMSTSVSSLGFRTANLDSDDIVSYDMFRMGTTWDDVVPIPEPSVGSLMMLALAMGIWRMLRNHRTSLIRANKLIAWRIQSA